MNRFAGDAFVLTVLLLNGCSGTADRAEGGEIRSVYTEIGGALCEKEIDRTDPNETSYLRCPGVRDYSLIVRRVDAGRNSIDIVDPDKRVLPLHYEEVVTRHMFTLGAQAEWRVGSKQGTDRPIALIVRVQAHEDGSNPARVTATYVAVGKITPGGACVTDRIPDGPQSETDARDAADSAAERACLPSQPPLRLGGTITR
jgi:hypothetical protein